MYKLKVNILIQQTKTSYFKYSLFKIILMASIINKNLQHSYGCKLLIKQEQLFHQKKLSQIYGQKPKKFLSPPSLLRKNVLSKKKQIYEDYDHTQSIKHLHNFISRKKNMADRMKDPNDFYAYPVYFFRQVQTNNKKQNKQSGKPSKRKQKPKKRAQHSQSQQSEFTRRYGIDVVTIKKSLPRLREFTQQQLQEYANCITKIIFNYNLNSVQRIEFLKSCVKKTILPDYPQNFEQVVEEMFADIMQSIDLDLK